jgi:hypothetical protein
MRHFSLLLAAPLLLLPACTINGGDPGDDAGSTDGASSDTDGHSSDPTAATEANTEAATEAVDDPANDNCVPQANADQALREPTVRESTTNEPDPEGTGGDGGESTGSGSDAGGETGGETGGSGTGSGTAGESASATEGDEGGAGEDSGEEPTGGPQCEPLPEEHPSALDLNCECDVPGEHRDCKTPDDVAGTRFCDSGKWGPCVVEPTCLPGTYTVCFFCDESFGTWVSWCSMIDGVPTSNADEDCATPLVLSFDGRAVEYTSDHAEFAMTASDRCGARDWPTAATPWLAIDLDHNGNIDGGHELFGTGSRLAGRVDNGFAALAALDTNADGQISASDERFAELVVWSDHDADRRSNLWELQPVTTHGVVAIDLGYEFTASRCNERGNCEGERATFIFEGPDGARSSGEIVDVRLACQ